MGRKKMIYGPYNLEKYKNWLEFTLEVKVSIK